MRFFAATLRRRKGTCGARRLGEGTGQGRALARKRVEFGVDICFDKDRHWIADVYHEFRQLLVEWQHRPQSEPPCCAGSQSSCHLHQRRLDGIRDNTVIHLMDTQCAPVPDVLLQSRHDARPEELHP